MELDQVMRTAFAAREYTDEEIPDATLYRLLDTARFAPSGGNRQGWRVIIVRDAEKRRSLITLMQPTVKQYLAQARAGEVPFNTINPSQVDAATIETTSSSFPLIDNLEAVPVLLVICVDLSQVTSFDRDLDRVGVISGASVYPFVWNILLAARSEGLGGVLTTFLAASEARAKELLKLPDSFAIASMVPLGVPVKQLTRLKRNPVEFFTRVDSWDGEHYQVP
jgi:nitroreductase